MDLSESYWEDRYLEGSTRWDLGAISPPIKAYIDQLEDRSISILIPGAGFGHEAEYLHHQGFSNVTVVDVSETALTQFQMRVPSFPKSHILKTDFFKLNTSYDLILEQTFFCALSPSQRLAYVKKTHELLNNKGKLVGLLFNFPLTADGPPFGGNRAEYAALFGAYYELKVLASAYNSIPPRQGNELFIRFAKKPKV